MEFYKIVFNVIYDNIGIGSDGVTTFSIMTFSIMTLKATIKSATLSIKDTRHFNSEFIVPLRWVSLSLMSLWLMSWRPQIKSKGFMPMCVNYIKILNRIETSGLYYKTIYGRNLLILAISYSVCPWQPSPAGKAGACLSEAPFRCSTLG